MVFIIYSSNYDPASGGNSITHHLCDYINKVMGDDSAFLCPPIQKGIGCFDFFNNSDAIIEKLEDYDPKKFVSFKTNPNFKTPLVPRDILIRRDNIVIYSEGIYGNPLEQDKVVRWILFFPPPEFVKTWEPTDMFVFYTNCYYNTYNFFYKEQDILTPMIKKPYILTILNHKSRFKNKTEYHERWGTCYTLRKGSKGFYFPTRGHENCNLKYIHNLSDSFHFEYESNLTNDELDTLFNQKRIFYAYDPFTYLSLQAAIAGCASIVVPIPGLSKEKLFEGVPHMKYGVAYGLEDIDHSLNTMHLVDAHLTQESLKNPDNVRKFCLEALDFFKETEKMSVYETGILRSCERILTSNDKYTAIKFLLELLSGEKTENILDNETFISKVKEALSSEYYINKFGAVSKKFLRQISKFNINSPIKFYDSSYKIFINSENLSLLRSWINYSQAAEDARIFSSHIPDYIDNIITTSKLSTFVAGVLASHKNITVTGTGKGNKSLVLVDELPPSEVLILKEKYPDAEFASLYVKDEVEFLVNYRYKVLERNSIQEWNFKDSVEFWGNSMIDFDGVLSYDPIFHYFSDPEDVREFHVNAKRYMLPNTPLGCIVTGRREMFRDSCLAWLEKYHVKFNEMKMNPNTIQNLELHANFKSEYFKNSECKYFVESEISQSITIAKNSDKPVLCIDDMNVY